MQNNFSNIIRPRWLKSEVDITRERLTDALIRQRSGMPELIDYCNYPRARPNLPIRVKNTQPRQFSE